MTMGNRFFGLIRGLDDEQEDPLTGYAVAKNGHRIPLENLAREPLELSGPPPIKRSTVGLAVTNCNTTRSANIAKEASLTAQIDDLIEQRRQARATIEAMEAALVALAADPALTEEERTAVDDAVHAANERAIEASMVEIKITKEDMDIIRSAAIPVGQGALVRSDGVKMPVMAEFAPVAGAVL